MGGFFIESFLLLPSTHSIWMRFFAAVATALNFPIFGNFFLCDGCRPPIHRHTRLSNLAVRHVSKKKKKKWNNILEGKKIYSQVKNRQMLILRFYGNFLRGRIFFLEGGWVEWMKWKENTSRACFGRIHFDRHVKSISSTYVWRAPLIDKDRSKDDNLRYLTRNFPFPSKQIDFWWNHQENSATNLFHFIQIQTTCRNGNVAKPSSPVTRVKLTTGWPISIRPDCGPDPRQCLVRNKAVYLIMLKSTVGKKGTHKASIQVNSPPVAVTLF